MKITMEIPGHPSYFKAQFSQDMAVIPVGAHEMLLGDA